MGNPDAKMELNFNITITEASEDQKVFFWWSYDREVPLRNLAGFKTLYGYKKSDSFDFTL